MRSNLKFALIPFASLVCVLSCQKDYSPGPAPATNTPPGNYSLQSAMASVTVMPKTVTLNAAMGGMFNGNSGTRYVFPANSFTTANGTPVTGDVQVTVTEYLSKVDMLFAGVLPISQDGPLISGGEFNVNVTQGGQELKIDSGKQYQVNLPQKGTPEPGMSLFTGEKDPTTNLVSWKPASATSGTLGYNGDTITISTDNIHFVNADQFMNKPNSANISIKLVGTGVTITDSFMVYGLLDNINSVFQIGIGIYSTPVVISKPMHFAALGVIKGNLYGGVLGITPTDGGNYTISVVKTTPSEFKKQLEALP